jgi:hypothetical protein
MSSHFFFSGVQDELLEKEANQRLCRLMDGAPYDATSAALLQKVEHGFLASIDIYSTHGPFTARVSAPTAEEAIDKALVRVGERLEKWRVMRFSKHPDWIAPLAPDMGVA